MREVPGNPAFRTELPETGVQRYGMLYREADQLPKAVKSLPTDPGNYHGNLCEVRARLKQMLLLTDSLIEESEGEPPIMKRQQVKKVRKANGR